MPQVIVGGEPVRVSWAEYFFSILPPDTPIEWRGATQDKSPFATPFPDSGSGIFRFAWWCQDALAAQIDTADGRRVGILPEFYTGMRVRRKRLDKELGPIGGRKGMGRG